LAGLQDGSDPVTSSLWRRKSKVPRTSAPFHLTRCHLQFRPLLSASAVAGGKSELASPTWLARVAGPIAVDGNAIVAGSQAMCAGPYCVATAADRVSVKLVSRTCCVALPASRISWAFTGCGFCWLPFLLALGETHQRFAHAARTLLRGSDLSVNSVAFEW